ncbi:MAG: PQQ-binding-like beta-propeller repeat protein [Phycisphaerae bacterium]|nr:PQQ-binding-like beta-propeller repeat protein [Phycisphaerae bacterium]
MPRPYHFRSTRSRAFVLSVSARLSAIALVSALAGCGSGGSGAGGGSASSGATATGGTALASSRLDRDGFSRLGYRLVWSGYASMSPGDTVAQASLAGDLLLIQDSSSTITALAVSSGEIRWAAPLTSSTTRFTGLVREGKHVLACSESEIFVVDAEAGTLLNKQRLARVVNTAPARIGGSLVFGTTVGEVLCHLDSGFKAWSYAIGGAIEADPIIVGDGVALASQAGQVIVLTPSGSASARYTIFGGLACNMAASDSVLYVASLDQSIYAFDAYGNRPLWRKRTDSQLRSTPTYHLGRLYVEVPSAGLLCLDAGTGKDIWTAKDVRGTVIAAQSGSLIVWDGKESVRLDGATGDVLERATLTGFKALVPDRFENGHLYAVTVDGAIHKFEPR